MAGFWRGIFAGPETASKVADAVIGAGDAVWFTDEEKSSWYIKYLEATQPQNRARRLIAVMVTGVWCFLVVVVALAHLFSAEYAGQIKQLLIDVVVQPYSIIIGFYFIKSWVSEAKK